MQKPLRVLRQGCAPFFRCLRCWTLPTCHTEPQTVDGGWVGEPPNVSGCVAERATSTQCRRRTQKLHGVGALRAAPPAEGARNSAGSIFAPPHPATAAVSCGLPLQAALTVQFSQLLLEEVIRCSANSDLVSGDHLKAILGRNFKSMV